MPMVSKAPLSDRGENEFQPCTPNDGKKGTKREILSEIARLFDPNGYIGPTIILAKIIMQRLWKSGTDWDGQVPEDISNDWAHLRAQLPQLTDIRIPRWIGTGSGGCFSLHGFADASEKAYGAVIYVRVESNKGTKCMILTSKSRVAPLKTVTIPRLELCAAKLLSELLQSVRTACRFEHWKTTLWTDSSIVLQWMTKNPDALKPFVHNRIQGIRKATAECQWRHVPSTDNPADLLSRGLTPAELKPAKMWWNAPPWLSDNSSKWPNQQNEFTVEIGKEIQAEIKSNWLDVANDQRLRPIQKAFVNTVTLEIRGEGEFKNVKSNMLTRTSNLRRLVRRTAWIRRFFYNYCRSKGNHCSGPLSADEEEEALWCCVRHEQAKYYSAELKALRKQDPSGIPEKSTLLQFNPFIDERNILRVGGRLEKSSLAYEQKHPAILPELSHLARLLIHEAHQLTLHGGYQLMAAHIRQRIWITGLRRAVHINNKKCTTCTRYRHNVAQQLMGDLPASRVNRSNPFEHTGVDYAGPFLTKPRTGRCKLRDKKWVAVFACMATKAVHLELVENLSSAAFIAAFIRFTSLRGACHHLWSDHGTNFTGAEKELGSMISSWADTDSDSYHGLRTELKVKWYFITTAAPHQGGLWEAAVRSMKYHLRRLVGAQILLSGDFRTLLTQNFRVSTVWYGA